MKPYLITTGIIFALIVLAHIARVIQEGSHLLTEPDYIILTLLAAALSTWAWILLFKRPSRPTQ